MKIRIEMWKMKKYPDYSWIGKVKQKLLPVISSGSITCSNIFFLKSIDTEYRSK
jgi:hypothetical protein